MPDQHRGAMSASARCPSCSAPIGVWCLNEEDKKFQDVFFHPDNHDFYEILSDTADLPDGVVRAYSSTIDAFNSGNYPATAVCCGRTLEGIFKNLLPEGSGDLSLAKSIDKVAESVDFAEPIRRLATVVRQGRNLGAHFDLEKEPDEKLCKAMVELLEYLISYLYVLPKDIASVEKVLDSNA
jgi:hypothetical protein